MVEMMYEDPVGRRMQVQQELLDTAQHFLSIRSQIPMVHEEKDKDFIIRSRWEGETPYTIAEIRADNI